MAGTPKKKQMLARIEEHADTIKALVAEGKTLKEMQAKTGFAFQRIHEWLKLPANAEWYKATKKAKATLCAEESVAILEKATRETIPVDRERSRSLQWMAERLDSEDWGSKAGQTNVQVNFAAAFLQALREGSEAEKGRGVLGTEFNQSRHPSSDR